MRTSSAARPACVWLLAATLCAFALPRAHAQPTPDEPKQVAAVVPAAKPAGDGPAKPAVSDDYVVGPGDAVQVFVWMNPELSTNVAVRPDGKISTPLVEDMVAAGKTPSQLARAIESVLGEYIRQPKVNVIVTQAISTFRQVQVVGQVRAPQSLAYRDGLKVLDVILAVGGVTDFAAANRTRIVRTENGEEREIKVRLGDLVQRGDLRQNLKLQPGDVLIVPESMF